MPKTRHNDRRCVATGEGLTPGALAIRFVQGPDETLVPDLGEKLPGRGAWLTAERSTLLAALKKNAFAKSFRAATPLPDGATPDAFADTLSRLLEDKALNQLGLARRAGQLVAGFDSVRSKAASLLAYICPNDAAPDGVRKISQALEHHGPVPHIPLSVDSGTLSHAVGDVGVVHLGLLPGKAAERALYDLRRWQAFTGDPGAAPIEK